LNAVLESANPQERRKRARRTWPDNEKRRMVAEALSPGASVADIARRHGINANLLFNWVRSARKLSLAAAGSWPASAACLAPEPPTPIFSRDFRSAGRRCQCSRHRSDADLQRGGGGAHQAVIRPSCGDSGGCKDTPRFDRNRAGEWHQAAGRCVCQRAGAAPGDVCAQGDNVIQVAPGTKVYLACRPVSMR
jgi:transposase-like protein